MRASWMLMLSVQYMQVTVHFIRDYGPIKAIVLPVKPVRHSQTETRTPSEHIPIRHNIGHGTCAVNRSVSSTHGTAAYQTDNLVHQSSRQPSASRPSNLLNHSTDAAKNGFLAQGVTTFSLDYGVCPRIRGLVFRHQGNTSKHPCGLLCTLS